MKNYLLKSLFLLVFVAFGSYMYAQTDVKLQVIDSTKTFVNVEAKGSWTENWDLVDMTLTNGDDNAREASIWEVTIQVTDEKEYEWGAIIDDGSEWGIWLPDHAVTPGNHKFTLAAGAVTGATQMKFSIDPVDVVIKVDMSFEIDSKGGFDCTTDSVGIAGSINGWSYTKGVKGASDSIYSITIQHAGFMDYKFRKNDAWEARGDNRTLFVDGKTDPLELDAVWYSDITPAPSVDVKFYVVDETQYYDTIMFKGAANGWTLVRMYDDGTNGDAVADDHTWTVTIENITAGAKYEWGATDATSAGENWLIVGSNVELELDGDGNVVGGDTYTISAWGDVAVHFMVNMNCHINLEAFVVGETCLDVNIDGYPPVEMTLVDTGVYEATITRFNVEDTLAYTYRLGCSFDGDYVEYPGFDENREYVVVAGSNETGVELYQDDVITAACPYEDGEAVANSFARMIQMYPNPVNNELRIDSEFEISTIEVFNIAGQRVLSNMNINEFSQYLNVEVLHNGVYLVSITGVKGEVAVAKMVKN